MIKIVKIGLLLLASLLMGAVILFLTDVAIIDVLAGSFFLVMNAFLGIDLAGMIKKSAALPSGEFKNMKFSKYVIALVIMLLLFGLSLYRKEMENVQAIMAISSFGGGSMLVIGYIIAGLEGNKIASNMGEK